MQVQKIQNYNYNPQFKGKLRFISPTGKRITIKPDSVEAIVSEVVEFPCRTNKYFQDEYGKTTATIVATHVLDASKVIFNSGIRLSSALVNAKDTEVALAIKEAKEKPDDDILDVGKPLDYIEKIKMGYTFSKLPQHTEGSLRENYPNTILVKEEKDDNGNKDTLEWTTTATKNFISEIKKMIDNADKEYVPVKNQQS